MFSLTSVMACSFAPPTPTLTGLLARLCAGASVGFLCQRRSPTAQVRSKGWPPLYLLQLGVYLSHPPVLKMKKLVVK